MRARWGEGGGRMLLGDNTSSRAVVQRPIKFQFAGVRRSSGVPYTHTHTHTYIYIYVCVCDWPYVYSFPICAKFYLRRTFRNVTIAWPGECLCRPSGICDRHCGARKRFSSSYFRYLLTVIFPPVFNVHFYHKQCYIAQRVAEGNTKEKKAIKLHLAPFGWTPRVRIPTVIICSAPAGSECCQMN